MLDQYEKELRRQRQQLEKEKREASFLAAQRDEGSPKNGSIKFKIEDTVNESRAEGQNKRKYTGEGETIDKKALTSPDNAAAKKQNTESLDPREISKTVLMKCNIIRKKKDNVPTLHKGEGHLSTMSEKTLKQIYQDVYHKTLESPK
mgnify:CR=1 FL=1